MSTIILPVNRLRRIQYTCCRQALELILVETNNPQHITLWIVNSNSVPLSPLHVHCSVVGARLHLQEPEYQHNVEFPPCASLSMTQVAANSSVELNRSTAARHLAFGLS